MNFLEKIKFNLNLVKINKVMTYDQTSNLPKLSVLMPVRNEGSNIKIMIKALHAVIEVPHELLFVYDHPNDDCIEIVNELEGRYPNTRLIHNQIGIGAANAIKAGVSASKGEYVLIFAVDELGPVLAIDEMLHLMDKGCEFISCTRYAHGGRRLGGSKIGRMLSWLANKLFFYMFNSALTDCTTGIKMFRKYLFDEIKFESGSVGWTFIFEMSIKAQLQGFKLGEVPIVSIDRLYGGESTFKLVPWFIEYLRWFVWGMRIFNLSREKENSPNVMRLSNI
jgi:dolichol-phosphate mannosyltransferase